MTRKTTLDRFFDKVEGVLDECWEWNSGQLCLLFYEYSIPIITLVI